MHHRKIRKSDFLSNYLGFRFRANDGIVPHKSPRRGHKMGFQGAWALEAVSESAPSVASDRSKKEEQKKLQTPRRDG